MNENPIRGWIDSLDESALQARMEQIEAQIKALQEERAWLIEGLEFKQRWNARSHSSTGGTMRPVPATHLGLDGPPPQGKTEAALRILGSDPSRDWATPDIAGVMIERGWMFDSEGDHASLASTLSRLFKEERIHRPQRGHYRLAPPGAMREEL